MIKEFWQMLKSKRVQDTPFATNEWVCNPAQCQIGLVIASNPVQTLVLVGDKPTWWHNDDVNHFGGNSQTMAVIRRNVSLTVGMVMSARDYYEFSSKQTEYQIVEHDPRLRSAIVRWIPAYMIVEFIEPSDGIGVA